MNKILYRINPSIDNKDWEDYVKKHPKGNIYHRPQWKAILEKSFNFSPFYIFAINKNKLCGFLPLFEIKSFITGQRLVSLPFSYICGPIADSEELEKALIQQAENLSKIRKCYVEIRSFGDKIINWQYHNYFSTYILKLSKNIPEVWQGLDYSNIRRAVKKAEKRGVTFTNQKNIKNFKIFHQLDILHKRKLGAPSHPWSLIKNIHDYFDESVGLYLAKYQGKFIGGILTLNFKDTVIYVYGAADQKYLSLGGNTLLLWQAIQDSCKRGYKYFDFGRVAEDNAGLIRYKKNWSTQEKKLFYYYYPKLKRNLFNNRQNMKYKILTNLWKKMPKTVSVYLSRLVYKHLE